MTVAQAMHDLSPDNETVLLDHTRNLVEQAVTRTHPVKALPQPLANTTVEGVFVTLKRAGQLRGCRGQWASSSGPQAASKALGPILAAAVRDTALQDMRFARLTASELPSVTVEVSVMFGTRTLTERGTARTNAVQIGRHGVVIHHSRGRGLLLPQVATEHGWDVATFLRQVCRKAGLPEETWKQNDAELLTFEARVMTQAPPNDEFQPGQFPAEAAETLVRAINDGVRGTRVVWSHPALTRKHHQKLGMRLTGPGGSHTVSLGSDLSLAELGTRAVSSIRELAAKRKTTPPPTVTTLEMFWQPIRLHPEDYPQRHRSFVHHTVLAENELGGWHLSLQDGDRPFDVVDAALRGIQINVAQWQANHARVTAFSVHRWRFGPLSPKHRTAAHAGQFYPSDAPEMRAMVQQCLAVPPENDATPSRYRAIMLPHAGWQFCGSTIGKTLRRVALPATAIIIGPKHTPHGAAWSIPPHTAWEIPGDQVPIAEDIADALLRRVPRFKREADAHRLEHGTEILLPFLRHRRSDLRILPVVLGADIAYDELDRLGRVLADICHEHEEAPLLVISSDMNHFASEPENRRLDQLALDAMLSGDPRQLFDTVRHHHISMCGAHPAVAIMAGLRHLSDQPLCCNIVDYTNSAATTGDTSRVVGYAGAVFM